MDVGSAGSVSIEVAEDGLGVAGLAAPAGWEASMESQTEGRVNVLFAGAAEDLLSDQRDPSHRELANSSMLDGFESWPDG